MRKQGRDCLLNGDYRRLDELVDANFDLRARVFRIDPGNLDMVARRAQSGRHAPTSRARAEPSWALMRTTDMFSAGSPTLHEGDRRGASSRPKISGLASAMGLSPGGTSGRILGFARQKTDPLPRCRRGYRRSRPRRGFHQETGAADVHARRAQRHRHFRRGLPGFRFSQARAGQLGRWRGHQAEDRLPHRPPRYGGPGPGEPLRQRHRRAGRAPLFFLDYFAVGKLDAARGGGGGLGNRARAAGKTAAR